MTQTEERKSKLRFLSDVNKKPQYFLNITSKTQLNLVESSWIESRELVSRSKSLGWVDLMETPNWERSTVDKPNYITK